MRRRLIALLALLAVAVPPLMAESWDGVLTSGKYYYGVGHGSTEKEASEAALAELISMIATNVSSEFSGLTEETEKGGQAEYQRRVVNCVRSYSQSSLTNVERMTRGKEPKMTVLRYILKSELARIYDGRIAKAKDMVNIARLAVEEARVDMALQHYYWAYALVRSVQRPNEVKDEAGHVLINWIPVEVGSILSKVKIDVKERDGSYVTLAVTYDGKPVSYLDFNYSDGRAECSGYAKNGEGAMELMEGYETDFYHLNIEYEYKHQAMADAELESVLNVIPRRVFKEAAVVVKANGKTAPAKEKPLQAKEKPLQQMGNDRAVSKELTVAEADSYLQKVDRVVKNVVAKSYSNSLDLFTLDGRDAFNKLIMYGRARLVGTPDVQLYKGSDGHVIARGIRMAFSFQSPGKRKQTFVEDVVLNFDDQGKICNVAFGLGDTSQNDILCRYAPRWKPETREFLLEFLENYKTAYCLKRMDYIRDVFSDDAVIITGYVVKRNARSNVEDKRELSEQGENIIRYNRQTKGEYLRNLERCFRRNEFINIRFSNTDLQLLEKFQDKDIFAIQLGQEYNSSTYADKGYLFLMVDMTDRTQPQIKVRTWQPNEVSLDKVYNAGDFYNE